MTFLATKSAKIAEKRKICITVYLSSDTLAALDIVTSTIPLIGEHLPPDHWIVGPRPTLICTVNNGCAIPGANPTDLCACPQHTTVPPRITALPVTCVLENVPNMKLWLLKYYAASTFNT